MKKKVSPLWQKIKYLKPKEKHSENHSELHEGKREWENVYRNRWQHDHVIRSTHGVNCTGSCSWNIFVKNGVVTWEGQALDYPSTDPDMPEYEPRGCPRGASFSWYIYSPLRVKYPYVRKQLSDLWQEAKEQHNSPLQAWESIVENKDKAKRFKQARGKGGLVRAEWDDVLEIISASMLYTIKKYGPDRNVGFSVIPAMSMLSAASGMRFMSLMGGEMLSFYDWYADLPPASPQIWGDQTDVPESSDWFNSSYIMTWGSNVPLTRTPDAHFMTEARYRGAKVISVSPDFAESTTFADEWLSVRQGTDGALAMAMGHVILNEFYEKNPTPYFIDYSKQYTDFPFVVQLEEQNGAFTANRYMHAVDLGMETENNEWKPAMYNKNTDRFSIPQGTMGSRWDESGKWNLELIDENTNEAIEPALSFLGIEDDVIQIQMPYYDEHTKKVLKQAVPVKKIELDNETKYITTVYDLMTAHYGIDRGIGGEVAHSYEDMVSYSPAWQEQITGVDQNLVVKIAREFAQNAIDTKGRSMIILGAGVNHWYNADVAYRTIINLVLMVGAQGVNGGGWAHYVGQEKLRPVEGWTTITNAKDWGAPKLQNGTSFFYFHTDQWRYEEEPVSNLAAATVDKTRYDHPADYNVLAARLGWLPSYPTFNKNGLDIYKDAVNNGYESKEEIGQYVAKQLKDKKLKFAIEDPDNPVNFPRNLFVWRANLISNGKGHEYFLKHLLGTTHGMLNTENDSLQPEEINWRDEGAEGKLDLLINLDFRMSGTALYSDIILPAATWYEKHDLSSTDMHPFVHPFNPAITPPWESRSDWNIFRSLAKTVSNMAEELDLKPAKEVFAAPIQHDSPGEMAQAMGKVKDWSKNECEPVPGKTMPNINVIERDYKNTYNKFISLGPNVVNQPYGDKDMTWNMEEAYEELKKRLGTINGTVGDGCPDITEAKSASEAVLLMSSTTNGKLAVKAWESLEKKTNLELKDYAAGREEELLDFKQINAQPKTTITSPAFTGSMKEGKRYSPFTTNIDRLIPFRTLTGRQSYFMDHDIMKEFGESFAIYKPILNLSPFRSDRPKPEGKEITLNYLTPHNKWSVHSMFFDSQPMLTLFRGGPTIWLNKDDAEDIGVEDNDWIECFNQNGVVAARAVVTHRLPKEIAFMHHAQDRHIYVPGSNLSKNRGGTHNSPTKIYMKPTHMIGGYGQQSYGFNYYGPTGNQRDVNVVIRKMEEVDWLED
ncbi:nitrate reductase subunit alpha [Virgibacillus sp. NKC19-3]|uniref:nitrate reductase subunit alpha n=1 Tax=Virgibacillus saliphilus TaxID=2831674 RepID=UPI001C9AD75B|nr:nitrate reductase subunit alpha [Virgibacillus sp. NKC19-3]MBY7143100.1 nitrate reductase subunit alpha [Virgibacillus sp. NKC19-3]